MAYTADAAEHTQTTAQVSNLVAFIQGKIPIANIEYGVDGKYYSINSHSQTGRTLFFEASIQTNTFYLRQLWRNTKTNANPSTNGIILGENSFSQWQIDSGRVYFSVATNRAKVPADSTFSVLPVIMDLAKIPFRLGFTEAVDPVSLQSKSSLLTKLGATNDLVADLALMPSGLIRTITYGITNSKVHAKCMIEYSYEGEGERPEWLPSRFSLRIQEYLVKSQKAYDYTETHYIRSCQVGHRDLPNGFTPDMFLPQSAWKEVVGYTNGVGIITSGGRAQPIVPFGSGTGALDGRVIPSPWMRVAAVLVFVGITYFFFRTIRETTKEQNNTKDTT